MVILDLATNNPRETKTNAQGEYRVFGLGSGKYQVSVSLAGMRTTQITGIEINGSDTVQGRCAAKVASASETVDVSAEAPLVNRTDQTISDTIGSRAVIELPRDSRDVYTFLYLNPNITQGSDDGEFKFLGAQSYGGNFSLDGQRSNGGIFGSPTESKPSLEAVGDINVLSNDFSAEYAGISNIRVTTKRGGCGLPRFGFLQQQEFGAGGVDFAGHNRQSGIRSLSRAEQLPQSLFQFHRHRRVIRRTDSPGLKKTWFFAAYERNWNRRQFNFDRATFRIRSCGRATFPGSKIRPSRLVPRRRRSTRLTPEEIANDTVDGAGERFITIPSRFLNPTVQNLIGTYFPKIGLGAAHQQHQRTHSLYRPTVSRPSVHDTGTLRVDHDFSDKDRVYAVYNGSGATI